MVPAAPVLCTYIVAATPGRPGLALVLVGAGWWSGPGGIGVSSPGNDDGRRFFGVTYLQKMV